MHTDIPEDKMEALAEALFNGRKIEAIKNYRLITGLGLKEAKEDVEAIEADLRTKHPEKFVARPPRAGCTGAAAMISLCAGAAVYFLVQAFGR